MYEELAKKGVRVHHIKEVLPDYDEQSQRYIISEHDPHPNALANEAVAKYVVDKIIRGSPKDRASQEAAPDCFRAHDGQ